ncbi:MAG: hypothetical protein AAF577_12765 [Pseudomonadota bacterium]
MSKTMTTGLVLRRVAFVAGYVSLCAFGTVAAVEVGTEIGTSAADMTSIHALDDSRFEAPVPETMPVFAENRPAKIH